MLKQSTSFLDKMPYIRHGIANFNLWCQLVIDIYWRVQSKVFQYLVQGEDLSKTTPVIYRSKVREDTLDFFHRVILESLGVLKEYSFDVSSREDLFEKCDELSHHSIPQRSSVWVHVIELLRQNKYNEATAIMATERLLFLEAVFIQRILALRQ